MTSKIIDIVFWTGVFSVILHFIVFCLAKDSPDSDVLYESTRNLFLSGLLVILSYWVAKDPTEPP